MPVRSEVDSVTPEAWANMLQPALRKTMVSAEISNSRFEPNLQVGDSFNYSYFSGDNTVVDYTEYTDIADHEKLETTGEKLIVDKKPLVRKHVDDVEQLYLNVSAQMELAEEAGYALKDHIDQDILLHVMDADSAIFDGDIKQIDTDNVINMMTGARKDLRKANVEEDGDWITILPPEITEQIELKATDSGFNVSDAAFRNGYAGSFVGFNVYNSNNLPEVIEVTDESAEIDTQDVTDSEFEEGDVVTKQEFIDDDEFDEDTYNDVEDDYKATACYFGKRGMIHTAYKQRPSMKERAIPKQLGSYFYFYTVYGSKVFEKYSKRFLKGFLRA